MFDGTRTIDWVMLVVEALVLGLISYEVVVGERRHRIEKQRRARVSGRVLEVSRLMDKGRRTQSWVPDPNLSNRQVCKPWMESVHAWTEETNAVLLRYSPQASAAFMLVTNSGDMDSWVHTSGRNFQLTGDVREYYQELVVRLANLRRILEQAETYF